MNDLEFHERFRLDRNVFRRLVGKKTIPSFSRKGLNLFMVVSSESTASANKAWIVYNYLFRASSAILQLEKVTMSWPDEDERRMITLRM
ncbi:hypothetical protein PHMEG_00016323 [Phytophthora megakarya]|uniref:Uncharacterized protein n=1 Tax=Phytophthora megakarya TaxID=4795 RepID=A0A225W0R6_9STRA|nr:hypothetical protein PHMEG_00016323 [Phytophthora megakarya]